MEMKNMNEKGKPTMSWLRWLVHAYHSGPGEKESGEISVQDQQLSYLATACNQKKIGRASGRERVFRAV